ncbi:hypothetical protein [Corallococcus carmarthensis]|uniref:hypothetical protein n=1 Tax=Corallococcus carmarthensis TaxID=2316728 RepID=UPI00148BC7F4|nr:hypothetical protein [Corallococcus carmarthensis]NOK22971.1 hypothetical protein [Corallococcus carmarthensis]
MRLRWAVLLGLGALGGCATARGPEATAALPCTFAFYETQEPSRPYEVIGEVPLTTNEWVNMGERKALLAKSVCGAQADGVILGHPQERKLTSGKRLREYRARLLVFTDTPGRQAAAEPPSLEAPPVPPGTILVPVMQNGLTDDLTGTQTRTVDTSQAR